MHTFLASITVGAIVGLLVYSISKLIKNSLEGLGLTEPGNGVVQHVLAGVAGWGLHVLMDSLMYPDIQPFTPIEYNPLHSPGSVQFLHYVYEVVFYAGSAIYLVYLMKHLRRRGLVKSVKLVTGLVSVGLAVVNLLISPLSSILLTIGFLPIDQGLSDRMHRREMHILVILLASRSCFWFYMGSYQLISLFGYDYSVYFALL